ncbi:MAG: hypothetical protein EOP04_32995, partial [Proteobacteria bacterium]
MKKTLAQFFEGSTEDREQAAYRALSNMAAEGRFMQEIFTHSRTWNSDRRRIDISEVVDHNSEEQGHWMI